MGIRVSKMKESAKAYLSGVGKRLKGLSEVLLAINHTSVKEVFNFL